MGQWPPQVGVTNNRRAFNRFMRGKQGVRHASFPKTGAGYTELMTEDGSNGHIIIAICPKSKGHDLACIIAHEAVHAARFLFHYVAEEEPSKEAEAYLIEHIVRHSLRHLDVA
jgi:hypothetical protein